MSTAELTQLIVYVATLLLCAWPLGTYMARIYAGDPPRFVRWLRPVERAVYRVCAVRDTAEMDWRGYALALLLFNGLGFAVVYVLQRVQATLPLNPMHMGPVSTDSAFNTAVSFVTNTNWQGYSGESTMSYLTQMVGLTVQNFLSAATGMAVLVAFIRGFTRKLVLGVGNFWVDLTRSTLYILLPLSVPFALVLVSQGVVQTLRPYATAALLEPTHDAEGHAVAEQTIALGPAASQIAIKQLGTNGGGFFNANSAHPFENPTPLSNFLQCLAILLIPAALCVMFGKMVRDRRQGRALLAAMTVVFVAFLGLALWAEDTRGPQPGELGVAAGLPPGQVTNGRSADALAGNMEGKEVRFGVANSVLWAVATTCASNGSVNSMHDSYTPLGGLVPLVLMQLGEVIFGGVGSGLYGMLIFVIVTVFIAGLMVGRTPEYLGKKIEAFEMKMASLAVLIPALCVLIGTAVAVVTPNIAASLSNPLPHGFSEVLYAYSSASNNNGSAFAGFEANTPTHNYLLGVCMLLGRFGVILPTLAIAGSLAAKKTVPASDGTLPTHTPLFVVLLIGVVLIVGALTFVPALALGPIAEQVHLWAPH
jgi:K+-transporting ATPase ATPase A chain